MNLKALINQKNIICNISVDSKKRLVEFLANRLSMNNVGVLEDDVIKSIYDRERIGNTYIGKKIYMPHCRVDSLQSTKIIICTLKKDFYDYRAKENINFVVAVFFPNKIVDIHYELLKELASFLKKPLMQDKLKDVLTSESLYKFIIENS